MVSVGAICCDCTERRKWETGCSDDALCTANICAVDSFCCDTRWDNWCANLALAVCYKTPYPTTPTTPTTTITQQPTTSPSSSMLDSKQTNR